MSDMERYGDYNEIDEAPGGKGPLGIIIKVMILLVCASVAAFMIFRIALFNYYPSAMEELYYTDSLSDYLSHSGEAVVETQTLRFPYDDADKGNFFCDNLILVREAGQLQVSVRYNLSLLDQIEAQYGVRLNPDEDIFEFSLAKTETGYTAKGDVTGEVPVEQIGTLRDVKHDSCLMYRYYKLSFDGVDFGLDDGTEKVSWIRLEIRIKGVEMDVPYMVLIYENHDAFSLFEEVDVIGGKSE